ncbi:unnamed protein product [Allacma fusca]|uniref:Uncharacterized protein n=1 Tax=Allacma fusca TaxID=39272 RepID=A0A8J2KZI5_9HEXA|nr:unnamed protein product [Allacma fusca]
MLFLELIFGNREYSGLLYVVLGVTANLQRLVSILIVVGRCQVEEYDHAGLQPSHEQGNTELFEEVFKQIL